MIEGLERELKAMRLYGMGIPSSHSHFILILETGGVGESLHTNRLQISSIFVPASLFILYHKKGKMIWRRW